MPSFTFVQEVQIGETFRPLDGWQYEYIPWPGGVGVIANSVETGIVITYTSGSETIVEESPLQAGGVEGVIPSALNTTPQGWQAAAGDRLKLNFRNTGLAASFVQGIIEVEPL